MISARELAAYIVLASFLVFFLSCGVSDSTRWPMLSGKHGTQGHGSVFDISQHQPPDFSSYEPLAMLTAEQFPLDVPNRRVIVVGDIHGMFKSLNKLLKTVNYNPEADVLVHVGDFLTKGPHEGSMAVLSFMAKNNITGVRGNHDQNVVEWRGWIDWLFTSTDGREWLERLERDWEIARKKTTLKLGDFVEAQRKLAPPQDKRWWKLIPATWKLLGDHYRIAREMSVEEYGYLLNLPLRLYIPSAHAFVVHAGLLPSDPRYPYFDRTHQPLARVPGIQEKSKLLTEDERTDSIGHMRNLQEVGILTSIPQNMDPWVVLNMRSVEHGRIHRKIKGESWSHIWRKEMEQCTGFYGELRSSNRTKAARKGASREGSKRHELPCYPSTVFYGHTASLGIDIKRWTLGLDSGCIARRKLSAIVIGGPKIEVEPEEEEDEEDNEGDEDLVSSRDIGEEIHYKRSREESTKNKSGDILPVGDDYLGQLISVNCR